VQEASQRSGSPTRRQSEEWFSHPSPVVNRRFLRRRWGPELTLKVLDQPPKLTITDVRPSIDGTCQGLEEFVADIYRQRLKNSWYPSKIEAAN
jgi:hypothetical protein